MRQPINRSPKSELNFFAMALGPGKHLKGLKLMNGLVTPEEVCCPSSLPSTWWSDAITLSLIPSTS